MKKIIITITLCVLTTSLYAGGIGTTAGKFMDIGLGAAVMSTGGAFGVVSDDVNALFFNPAGIGGVQNMELTSTYGILYNGINYGSAGFVKSFPGFNAAVGVSAMYLMSGTIPSYDDTGTSMDPHEDTNMGLGISFAYNLGNISLGVTGKYIDETLADTSASAMDADIGIKYSMGTIVMGLSVQNILQSEITHIAEGFPLSRNILLGLGIRIMGSGMIGINASMDSNGRMNMKMGGEYLYNNTVFLRAGYNMPLSSSSMNLFSGISGGAGLAFNKILVDYALVPYGELGLTHRFSLTLKM